MATFLVTTASRHGGTAAIGDRIAEVIRNAGHNARTAPGHEVRSLDGVDALVVGCGLYYGGWTREAEALVARLGPELKERAVWAFSSGPLGDPLKPEGRPARADAQAEKLGAREHKVFAGRLPEQGLSFAERAVVRTLRVPAGDWRPWAEIEAWAREIAAAVPAGGG